jgi:hypothetical protein
MQLTELGHRPPSAAEDDHLSSLLDSGQKLGESRLGLVYVDLQHEPTFVERGLL